MRWSQLRKQIEDLFADSVRDRVQIGATTYGKRREEGRGWIVIDGQEILSMTWTYAEPWHYPGTEDGCRRFVEATREAQAANVFSYGQWLDALSSYLSLPIDEILQSEDPLIRAVGMLDARLGKRRLRKIDTLKEHKLVRRLFRLRCEAENIALPDGPTANDDLTSRLKRPSWPGQNVVPEERRVRAIRTLAGTRVTRDVAKLIPAVYRGRVGKESLDAPIARELSYAFEHATDPSMLFDVLRLLQSKTKLLDDLRYIRGVLALTNDAAQWLRPIETWRPRSHNRQRQFSSLVRHLFARFDVPAFMDQAWLQGNTTYQEWFKHIGRGGSMRTAPGLPVPLSKKMAHHFLAAPDDYPIEAAILWGQVHAVGGDQRLADALRGTRLRQDFHDNGFRLSLLRFFAANPLLDLVHVGPIIDYIWHEKYENRVVFVERGVAQEVGPAQPNFSMRGRTVPALLRQVEAWHRQLGRESKGQNLRWNHSAIRDWQFNEGTKQSQNMKVWRIRELLSGQELAGEGRKQRHCVATYARSCHTGKCSIWAMDCETEAGQEKCVTIEVHNADKTIRQVRGKGNRFPTPKEKEILQRWATQAGLRIAPYLL